MTSKRDAAQEKNRRPLWEERRRRAQLDPAYAAEYQWDLARRDVTRIADRTARDEKWRALEANLLAFNLRFTRTTPAGKRAAKRAERRRPLWDKRAKTAKWSAVDAPKTQWDLACSEIKAIQRPDARDRQWRALESALKEFNRPAGHTSNALPEEQDEERNVA